MADKCLKTKICRTYNAPSKERLDALLIQVGVGAVAQFVVTPLIKQNGIATEQAVAVENVLNGLYIEYCKLQCNLRFVEIHAGKVADVLLELWPADKDTNAIHMLATSVALIIEMRGDLKEFWAAHPHLKAPEIWQQIEDGLEGIYDLFNAELSEDYIYADRVPEAVEKLHNVIWPESSVLDEQLNLYLVNDNYWVAASSSTHAKQIVMHEQQLEISRVELIQLSEIFEDGRSGADVLKMAQGDAGIIALQQ